MPQNARLTALRELGVSAFAPLVYPHKPGVGRWLNDWAADFVARVPEAVATGTFWTACGGSWPRPAWSCTAVTDPIPGEFTGLGVSKRS